ncbi:MAG: tetrahydrofolate dehydrogenase/cyclohydrolase catalytic domain-containing protein [bacterium]
MTADLLSGAPIAERVLSDVQRDVDMLNAKGITPGLGTILVGADPASAGYVRKKHDTCERVGIASFHADIPATATQADLLKTVQDFNNDPAIHAFIIQNPVPKGFDFNEALNAMSPEKDADGLHPENLGKLVLQQEGPRPCTPAGIVEMLRHYEIETAGKHVVVIGRGPTLGRPLALMLSMKQAGANSAVTVVHSAVPNIRDYTLKADILISAIGVHGFVTPDMVKKGVVAISGGISWEGSRLLPDIDETVGDVAAWITPRIGGVGPTTVALLLQNTVKAASRIV